MTLAAGVKIYPQLLPAQDRPQYAQVPCTLMTLLVLTVSFGARDLPWTMSLCLVLTLPVSTVAADSQAGAGHRHCPAAQRPAHGRGAGTAPMTQLESTVVEQLLVDSLDKAYGKQVLTWNGGVSAVSWDAIQSAASARRKTILDEWDEEFDRGKVKKVKKRRREQRHQNPFQWLHRQRSFWAVTHPAKAASLRHRL
ncbi:ubiquitin carboxyl-terminal hydrolase 36-like [Lathamus discolor]|uniref:ubiquitin carboxyl-terminal hydrolase 36-like n=1 Tax=Lathamus discolor TaxID=678569 RepID=UPI0032B729FB